MLLCPLFFFFFFFLLIPRPPISTLFPYTTLFRSLGGLQIRFGRHDGRMRRGVGQLGRVVVGLRDRLAVEERLAALRSEEHTSELQSHSDLVCRLLLEKKKKNKRDTTQNKS